MLTEKFINQAIGLARLFTDRNLVVLPKPNTVIDRINVTLNPDWEFSDLYYQELNTEEKYNSAKQRLLASTEPNINQLSEGELSNTPYMQAFEYHFKEQKEKLQNLLYVAYNHALPLVKELHKDVTDIVENNAISVARNFNVVVLDTPKFLENFSFSEQFNSFKDIKVLDAHSVSTYATTIECPAISEEELSERIKTGIIDVDKVLSDWAAAHPGGLMDIYNKVFLKKELQEEKYDDLIVAELMSTDKERVYNNAIIFILAKSLFDHPLEGTVVTINEIHKDGLITIREQAGRQLFNEFKTIESKLEQGSLVVEYNDKNQSVVVFDKKYDEFLKLGGSIEALLGALLSQKRPYSLQALLLDKEEFVKIYRQNNAFIELSDLNNRQSYQRRVASEVFMRQVKDAVENAIDTVAVETVDTLKNNFIKTYDSLLKEDHENFLLASIKLISRTRFVNTDIEKFLVDFYRMSEKYPEFEARDVGALVMVSYVGTWLSSMLTTKVLVK